MERLTWKKENGEWGLHGYDIKKVPTELYGALCKLKDYEEIGTVRECSEAVKKQKPEKPLNTTKVKTFNGKAFAVTGTCPVCNSKLVFSTLKYCYICGQAIDRSVADETST